MKISVVIAAKNEESMLPDCIRSVKRFADDVVVVDDMSTDRTVEVAKKMGARVFKRELDGFSTQKNFGVSKAKNDWVLILDADERATKGLADELVKLRPQKGTAAYDINFKNHIGKKWIRYGGLYPDPHTRLFDRRHANYGAREIHEILEVDGNIDKLKNDIVHYTYADVGEYMRKVEKYAKLEASWAEPRRYRSGLKVFISKFIIEKGFKDGIMGLISALLLGYYQVILVYEQKKNSKYGKL